MSHLSTPCGKLHVSQAVIDLMQDVGTPCKASDRSSIYVQDGYEYHWSIDGDGRMRTKVKKHSEALQSQESA